MRRGSRAVAALPADVHAEADFRALVESAPMGLLVHRGGVVVYANPRLVCMLGYANAAELVGCDLAQLVHPDDRGRARDRLERLARGKPIEAAALRMIRADGEIVVVEGSGVTAEFDGEPARVVVLHDVTERERHAHARASAEYELRRSLAEKESLLGEVHHRVKNNLQVITSLIALQSSRVDDPQARLAFTEMRRRVRTIASIHERMYRARAFDRIDAADYLRGLVDDVARSVRFARREIDMQVDAESVTLPPDGIVPLALFVNEAVSNSLEHAFVGRAHGRLCVTLRRCEGVLELSVADDGIGLAGVDPTAASTLGLSLIRGLARQLGGTVSFEASVGTRCALRFPDQELERGLFP